MKKMSDQYNIAGPKLIRLNIWVKYSPKFFFWVKWYPYMLYELLNWSFPKMLLPWTHIPLVGETKPWID